MTHSHIARKANINWLLAMLLFSSNGFAKCNQVEAEKGVQQAIDACAYESYQAADKKLDALYKALLKRMNDPDEKGYASMRIKALKESQTTWVKYRNAECEFKALDYYGGSMQPTVRAGCLEALTKQRYKALNGEGN